MSGKRPSTSADRPLHCPTCGAPQEGSERFCTACGMPLVLEGDVEPSHGEAHERARKIRPEYTHGRLVRVAGGRNQAEAELIQNLLLEEGVPSMVRRSAGFDVPDFLAAGPRDVLVPQSGAAEARELLQEADLAATVAAGEEPLLNRALLIAAAVLAAGTVAAVLAWLVLGAAS